MKRIFFALLGLTAIATLPFSACSNKSSPTYVNCTDAPPRIDSAALVNFASANGIAPLQDTIGLYYQIVSQGTGVPPTLTSTISVTYRALLLDGEVFDSTGTTPRSFVLNTLIPAWQWTLPWIQPGGRIKLLVPSAYAYGCVGAGSTVPSNTPVYFDITLVGVQ
jgi:FKBP-type peptidyl-prolyl cis-trans isomerase